MKYIVIYNEKSGKNNNLAEIKHAFKQTSLKPAFIALDKNVQHRLKKELTKDSVVVAAGGDGTVNAVINLTKARYIIGVIPSGTLNHFAKDIGLPMDIDNAVKCLEKNKVTMIDVALANRRYFVNNSSIGLYPYITRFRDRYKKYFGKWPTTVIAVIMAFVKLPGRRLTYSIDGAHQSHHTPLLFIGNNSYKIHKPGVNNRTQIDSGKLSIYTIKQMSRVNFLITCIKIILGKASSEHSLSTASAHKAVVESKKSLWIAYDGEVEKLGNKVTYTIKPGGLKIVR